MADPTPTDFITSAELASDHGIDPQRQLTLLDSGKLTAYRREPGKPKPVYPSMEPPYAGCEKPLPYPPLDEDGKPAPLNVRWESKAEYRQLVPNEVGRLTPEAVGELFFKRAEVIPLKTVQEKPQSKRPSRPHPALPPKSRLTKRQQLVLRRKPEWRKYCEELLKNKASYPMAKAIENILKQDIGLNEKGERFSDDCVRNHIKDLFPGKPGRPRKRR